MTPPSKRPEYASKYAKLHRNGYRLSVDATVVRRMIRALQAIGYTHQQIADEAGVASKTYVGSLANGRRLTVYLSTERALRDAYSRLHMKPRDDIAARKVITYAKKRGWAPPLAWTDITNLEDVPMGVRK